MIAAASIKPLYAEGPVGQVLSDAGSLVLYPPLCDEQARLAHILITEANVQPDEAHWAVTEIVFLEARSRGMTICQLSEQTNFVAVWHYAQAHPNSWHARQFSKPPPAWASEFAWRVLTRDVPADVRRGAMHFGGECGGEEGRSDPAVLWWSGQICFRR